MSEHHIQLCGIVGAIAETYMSHPHVLSAGVVGVGVGNRFEDGGDTGEPCIQVFVERKLPAHMLGDRLDARWPLQALMGAAAEEVPVDVVEAGGPFEAGLLGARLPGALVSGYRMYKAIRAARRELRRRDGDDADAAGLLEDLLEMLCGGDGDEPPPPDGRFRPVVPGVSVGHEAVTAGTVGLWVHRDGQPFLLSNNHVVADTNRGEPGDHVLQPGRHDGGSVARDRIGALAEFIPIDFSGENLVDAAIATISEDEIDASIRGIGPPSHSYLSTDEIEPGMPVRKSGRTTGVTEGTVRSIGATVRVNYGNGRQGRFVNQIIVSPGTFSAPGDSGSGILSETLDYVGLLYAGSDMFTVANSIEHVLESLNVELL